MPILRAWRQQPRLQLVKRATRPPQLQESKLRRWSRQMICSFLRSAKKSGQRLSPRPVSVSKPPLPVSVFTPAVPLMVSPPAPPVAFS